MNSIMNECVIDWHDGIDLYLYVFISYLYMCLYFIYIYITHTHIYICTCEYMYICFLFVCFVQMDYHPFMVFLTFVFIFYSISFLYIMGKILVDH